MAELREIAWRIATALHRGTQSGLYRVDLWNQSPDSAAHLVRLAMEECCTLGVKLETIRIDPYVAVALGTAIQGTTSNWMPSRA